jgi:hypothetical protein
MHPEHCSIVEAVGGDPAYIDAIVKAGGEIIAPFTRLSHLGAFIVRLPNNSVTVITAICGDCSRPRAGCVCVEAGL